MSRMLQGTRRSAIVVICTMASQACGAPRVAPPRAEAAACIVAQGTAGLDTLAVVVDGPVDPANAPVPSGFDERIVFGHLYQTLIRVDCAGHVGRGLAAAWHAEEGGWRWRFELRSDAVFSDGSPVTAAAVAASWSRHAARRPRPWRATGDASVTVLGERTLLVTLDRPQATVPLILADPRLAVDGPTAPLNGWPAASGSLAPTGAHSGAVTAVPGDAMGRDALESLVFRWGHPDPRDAVDSGFDVLVTRAPAVSSYASSISSARVFPLAWDRVYVLLVPDAQVQPNGLRTFRLEEDLTAAAAGADARVSRGSYWWDSVACRLRDATIPSGAERALRVVYGGGDRTARGLAERLVALTASGRLNGVLGMTGASGTHLMPVGLAPGPFAERLRSGADIAYVVRIDRTVLDPCNAAQAIRSAAPWSGRLVPLVDTRAHLVVKRLRGAIEAAWDGAPFIAARQLPP